MHDLLKKENLPRFIVALVAIGIFLTAGLPFAFGQVPSQLSLADILIALRSKKATLEERNRILTDAVASRGTTFSLTPEIEKELSTGGADKSLISSIKQRMQIARVAPEKRTESKPKIEAPVEPVRDSKYYEASADAKVAASDLDAALLDYNKAVELDGRSMSALSGRASLYTAKKAYVLAIGDLTKMIELKPAGAEIYIRRGEVYEKNNASDLAAADYKKASEIDPKNEAATAAYARLRPAPPKPVATPAPEPAPAIVFVPQFIDLGQLSEADAVKMAKPVYPEFAIKANVGGKVTIAVELDTDGNVTTAKVTSGHPFLKGAAEDAARKSKFKPATFDGKPIKAHGFVVYNFAPRN